MCFFNNKKRLVKNSTFLALTPKEVNSGTGLKYESHSHTGLNKPLKKSSFTKQEISIKCHGAIISEFGSKLDVGLTRFWVENLLFIKNSSCRSTVGMWRMPWTTVSVVFQTCELCQQSDIECRLLFMQQTTLRSLKNA
jgi:hypothetical protein